MEKLNTIIQKTACETEFSGVVTIWHKGEYVCNSAFGYRNRSETLLNNPDTRFGIASGTKLFTALGVGVLIEAGKLTLDTTINGVGLGNKGFIDAKATIAHLLTHTSGTFDYFDEETETDQDNFFVDIPWYRLDTHSDYVPLFQGRRMKFTPGNRFSYSNDGYVLLGVIIEQLSGMPYRDFIQEKVLAPAGMGASGFYAFNDLLPNTAYGYLGHDNTTNIYNIPVRGGGDGGMYTTAPDLVRF